jgi:hypothetical protein
MEPGGSLPQSQELKCPRLFCLFRNIMIFYGEELLAPRPTPKLEDNPCRLSATAYSMYSKLPSITGGRSSIRNLRTRHAVVTGTHLNTDKLFNICINYVRDIPSDNNVAVSLCACNTFRSDSTDLTTRKLHSAIKLLEPWFKKWRIKMYAS